MPRKRTSGSNYAKQALEDLTKALVAYSSFKFSDAKKEVELTKCYELQTEIRQKFLSALKKEPQRAKSAISTIILLMRTDTDTQNWGSALHKIPLAGILLIDIANNIPEQTDNIKKNLKYSLSLESKWETEHGSLIIDVTNKVLNFLNSSCSTGPTRLSVKQTKSPFCAPATQAL